MPCFETSLNADIVLYVLWRELCDVPVTRVMEVKVQGLSEQRGKGLALSLIINLKYQEVDRFLDEYRRGTWLPFPSPNQNSLVQTPRICINPSVSSFCSVFSMEETLLERLSSTTHD